MGMIIQSIWSEQDQVIQDGHYVRPASRYDGVLSDALIGGLASEPGRSLGGVPELSVVAQSLDCPAAKEDRRSGAGATGPRSAP